MIIMKFGGSSLADSVKIKHVCNYIAERSSYSSDLTAVFSASGDTTDHLLEIKSRAMNGDVIHDDLHRIHRHHINIARALIQDTSVLSSYEDVSTTIFSELSSLIRGVQLLKECSDRTTDAISGIGERYSTSLIHHVLLSMGLQNTFIDARTIIKTNNKFGKAEVQFEETNSLITTNITSGVYCVTGFIASNKDNISTTLGRGGSDYTAAILGGALKSQAIEIYTDVTGVLTTDPRIVPHAKTIQYLSYEEAQELSHFGAKVLYGPTIIPAVQNDIPILIKNTAQPQHPGTLISSTSERPTPQLPIKGIAAIKDIVLITLSGAGMVGVPGISARLFSALSQREINIIFITQGSSEHAITIGISSSDELEALQVIHSAFDVEIARDAINRPTAESQMSIIALVGSQMKRMHGIAGKIFNTLGNHRINIQAISQGSSELNVSIVVHQDELHAAIKALHGKFFEKTVIPVHLFVMGIGLVGKTFFKQLSHQLNFLQERHNLDIKVLGIANSKKMIVRESGLPIDDLPYVLREMTEPSDVDVFMSKAQELDVANPVFVDITASGHIASFYGEALKKGLHVATPNKKAFSVDYNAFLHLFKQAANLNRFVVHEATVGAGLPIINTLQGLIQSGDEITSIEGIFSGSLSFIFNQLNTGAKYSDAIRQAKELGFTEPDPRDDLSGMDFKRKLIILSNLAGFNNDVMNLTLPKLLPKELMSAGDIPTFMSLLDKADDYIAKQVTTAQQQGKQLKLIGNITNDKASLSLQVVDASSPFYNLSGSDNIVAIYSRHYHSQPLIVRGPGAGAEVTAGGLLADIVAAFKTTK